MSKLTDQNAHDQGLSNNAPDDHAHADSSNATKRPRKVAASTSNAFFKSTAKTAAGTAPQAEDTPRYVTRQTAREMAMRSKETTEAELAKLGLPYPRTSPSSQGSAQPNGLGNMHGRIGGDGGYRSGACTSNTGGCFGSTGGSAFDATFSDPTPTSYGMDPSAHHIMHQYAEKQHGLCNQICQLNQRLQQTQDQLMRLKEAHHKSRTDYEDQIAHLNEVSSGYDEEVTALTEKLTAEQEATVKWKAKCKDASSSFYTLLFSTVMTCIAGVALRHMGGTDTTGMVDADGVYMAGDIAQNITNTTEYIADMFGVL